MKRPRVSTARRASAAMNAAPARATESASGSVSIFMTIQRRVVPAARGRYARVDLFRPPRARFVFVDRRAAFQDGIDNSPRLFDVVLSREERRVSAHRVAEHAF